MEDGSGLFWDFQTNKMSANDVMLYAQYKKNNYELSFDSNGGNSQDIPKQTIEYDNLGAEVNPPIKEGWNMAKNGSAVFWNFEKSKML